VPAVIDVMTSLAAITAAAQNPRAIRSLNQT
jgi:hypothetical protein